MTELEPVAWIIAKRDGGTFYEEATMIEELADAKSIPLVTLSSAQSAIAERDARIEELERHLATWIENAKNARSIAETAEARATAAEALLKEAGKVLEPFADVATTEDDVGREDPEDDRILVVQAYGCQLAELAVAHFRAARAIHDKIGVKDDA